MVKSPKILDLNPKFNILTRNIRFVGVLNIVNDTLVTLIEKVSTALSATLDPLYSFES